ncbi:outer membrane beta-barrel family protein [Taibaiella chishuiensis]|uniref:Outer membrane receptor protein involved in Fe transport n=1 Tax=Taibaiella chishuiensis TaxID=1434707 RepID=A0A2P8CV65_9BACT|nr:outer membrane beta-barrel family protein [Taibaiella chishuiensis]PSK88829.1 outer membrane receptor protein involved in Fe transport [Taibaiella chishuiensis]
MKTLSIPVHLFLRAFTVFLFSLLLLAGLPFSPVYGQAKANMQIRGTVTDSKQNPVSFATVGVFRQADSGYVEGVSAGDEGDFMLDVPTGKYFLRINMIGFENKVVPVAAQKQVQLGTVVMKESSHQLEEVQIKSDKEQMELKLDKRVFNVASSLNASGANATEVLENIPAVTVDGEGNISLRGNANVRILVDGKYSGLANSADALQQLQASMIDKIEVITNASARYDAQGQAGIINIILKKDHKGGWNGAVNGNIGYNRQFGGGFNLNYRKGKVNLYGNYAISQRDQPGKSHTYQRYNGADTAFTYEQEYTHERKKFGNNGMIGLDYTINAYNTLSLSAFAKSGLGNNFYWRKYNDLTKADEMIGYSLRLEDQKEIEDYYEASLSYKRTFTRKDKLWTVDMKWSNDQDIERSAYTETSTYSANTDLERSSVASTERNWLFQTDFVQPFGKEGRVEAGLRSAIRQISNEFGFAELTNNGAIYPPRYNDLYHYDEYVHAAYLMAGNTFGRLSAQLGLRGELSDVTIKQRSIDSKNNKRYFNLFPSLSLSYKLMERNTLQLSYSRRVNRPDQWDLLPFTKFGDNREMRLGNPDLNPEFTHSFELGLMQNWEAGSLLSSVYYRNTSDVIQFLSTVDANGLVQNIARNLASEQYYGFEFNFNYQLLSWLKFTTGLNLFRSSVSGTFQGRDLERSSFAWTDRSALNATLPGGIRAQASFNYRGAQATAQGRSLATYYLDMAVSKELLKGNATVTFNVRDVFNTRKWRNVTDTPELFAQTEMQWRPRSFQLSFSYRFNQKAGQERNSRFDSNNEG